MSGPAGNMETTLLQELIYERVRVSVDIAELLALERDLAAGVARTLEAWESGEDRDALARSYLEEAWGRVEREWKSPREPEGGLQCPLCGELTADS